MPNSVYRQQPVEEHMHAPKFNWEFNFGHVLTSITMAISIASGVWWVSSSIERQTGRINALEASRTQYVPLIESMNSRLGTADERISNLAETVRGQRRVNTEILTTLGTIRENVAAINARTVASPQPRQ